MTLSEFKAWLEGYSEAFTDGVPNADQWAKVQAKLGKIDKIVAPGSFGIPTPPFQPKGWDQRFVADEINPALVPKVTC